MVIQRLKHLCNALILVGGVILHIESYAITQQFSFNAMLVQWKTPMNEDYSPFDQNGHYYKVMIECIIPQNSEGDYFIGFGNSNGDDKHYLTDQRGNKLQYYISLEKNSHYYLMDWPNITSDSQTYLLTVEDSSLPVERFPIYIWVEPGQINPPGQYIDQIPIKVYEGSYSSGSIPTIVGRGTVSIQLKLSNQVQLAIGNRSFNRSGEFNIKFEELIKGKALVYDVHIDSNNAYDIDIES